MGSFQGISDIEKVTAQEGEPVTLHCDAPKSVPPATYSWSRITGTVDSNVQTPISEDRRIHVDGDGKFYVEF